MPAHRPRTGIREPSHGVALFEAEILLDFRRGEASMLDAGFVSGDPVPHRLLTRGPDVHRVKRIDLQRSVAHRG